MKIFFKIIGYLLIGTSAAMMLVIGVTLHQYGLRSPRVENCMMGKFVVPAPVDGGLIVAGEIQFCGTDLNLSPVYGPNMEIHMEQLREENAALRFELASCQERQAL